MNKTVKWYILATIAITIWGIYYLFSKYTTLVFLEVTSTSNMAFWWFLWAFIVSSPYYFRSKEASIKIKNVTQENLSLIVTISFLSSVAISLYWYVLTLTEVWTIALLSQSNVFFSLALSMIFMWESINRKEMKFLTIVIVWFIILSLNNPELWILAFFLILLTRFLYAIQSLLVKKYWKNIDGFIFWYVRTFLIMLFLGIFSLILWSIEFISWEFWWYTTLSVMLGAMLLKSIFFEAHKYLEVWRLNIFMLFQAIITIVWSVIFFSESLTVEKIIGTIFIIWWLVFFTKEQLKRKLNKKD